MDNPHKLPWHIEGEIWKSIPGFQHYEASNLGRIRRIETGRIMQPSMSKGYWHTLLCENGKRSIHRLHKLVCLAFHGRRPDGYVINHKDGNKTNNLPENLEYTTQKKNMHHAIELGLFDQTKHSPETIQRVIDLLNQTAPQLSCVQIAKMTGVPRSVVMYILRGNTSVYEAKGVRANIRQDRQSNPKEKLTDGDVKEIKRLIDEGNISQRKLAAMFGVHEATISVIKSGKRRKKVA